MLAVDRTATRFPPGIRYMAAGAFFFSVMSLLVKLAGQSVPSQEIVLVRSLIMAAITFVALRRRGIRLRGERPRLLVARGLLGFGALSCFYYGLVHLPLADATVIQYTNPAFAAVFAVFTLGERMRPREILCVALSLAGVMLVARPGFLFGAGTGLDPVAVAVALLGAVLSAAAYVTVRMLAGEHHLVVTSTSRSSVRSARCPAHCAIPYCPARSRCCCCSVSA